MMHGLTRNQGRFLTHISWGWSGRLAHAIWDSTHDRWDGREIIGTGARSVRLNDDQGSGRKTSGFLAVPATRPRAGESRQKTRCGDDRQLAGWARSFL